MCIRDRYRWSPTNTKLDYSLQNASINTGNGSVSGGDSTRVNEGLTIRNVFHYKPVKHFETCGTNPSGNITAANNSTTVSGSSTAFTTDILPGDQIYANESGTPVWLGTVQSVSNNTTLSLVSIATQGVTNDSTWSVISPRVKYAPDDGSQSYGSGAFDNAPKRSYVFSGGALSSGITPQSGYSTPNYNVISTNNAGYQRYNFRFGIAKRTYNQTPLLNTKGEITPVAGFDNAAKIIKPAMGDLSRYLPANFNIEVTRLNPKTHVERSISIVGKQANI